MTSHTHVLILAGGPDPEHAVSLMSAQGVADALRATSRFRVDLRTIGRVTADDLRAMPGDVIFPLLHGRFGEGGPLQLALEASARPFVGSDARTSRIAIDKVLTKAIAQDLGIACQPTAILDPQDPTCPFDLPVVVKPVFEGSTIGLHVCHTQRDWHHAHTSSSTQHIPVMIEPFIKGRELTVGFLDAPGHTHEALPIVEIHPADGLYDYEAKYTRDDTDYIPNPTLPKGIAQRIAQQSCTLSAAIGVRHLSRSDFILSDDGTPWFLEINTMPGFTGHSLYPMAARAMGIDMPDLCGLLTDAAIADV